MTDSRLKFIDLFAGIGGFHIALERLGHQCVFASELSVELRDLYEKNYGIACNGDITKIDIKQIPPHDILCAGFPCQSFSKAGNQKGMKEARGKLFDEIIKILAYRKPRYFILENVRNLLSHNKGATWEYIADELHRLGYYIDNKVVSPHFIDIPQHRERVFIVGSLESSDIENMIWVEQNNYRNSIENVISHNHTISNLGSEKREVLEIWNRFLMDLPDWVDPYRPLWSMEFGATYPVNINWQNLSLHDWQKFKGSFGSPLSECNSLAEVFRNLPNYVRTQNNLPPKWKQNYIINNRLFYEKNNKYIKSSTINSIRSFNQESWKKLEWNCKGDDKLLSNKLIQFRGSGIRIKRNNYFPSLVTVKTQVPIIGKYMRYVLPEEAAKVQSLPKYIQLPSTNTASFRVLGNMVNVELVYRIASSLLSNPFSYAITRTKEELVLES